MRLPQSPEASGKSNYWHELPGWKRMVANYARYILNDCNAAIYRFISVESPMQERGLEGDEDVTFRVTFTRFIEVPNGDTHHSLIEVTVSLTDAFNWIAVP